MMVDIYKGQNYIKTDHDGVPSGLVMSARSVLLPLGDDPSWRQLTQRWRLQEAYRPRFPTGEEAVDALLDGGWPVGKVAELVGMASSGKTSLAVATVATATARGELALWVDTSRQFDAASMAAAGVCLEQLLLVQAEEPGQAVRAVELVLEASGFTVVVVDLGEEQRREGRNFRREERARLPLRLARAVERAGVVGLVLTSRPWVGTWAGVQVVFSPGKPRFVKEEGAGWWFAGFTVQAQVERGRARQVGRRVAWVAGG